MSPLNVTEAGAMYRKDHLYNALRRPAPGSVTKVHEDAKLHEVSKDIPQGRSATARRRKVGSPELPPTDYKFFVFNAKVALVS
jgi:hypothetical protein